MNDVSPQVSFALGQFLTMAGVLAGLLFWRSPSLLSLVSIWRQLQRQMRIQLYRSSRRKTHTIYWLRAFSFVTFFVFCVYGYYLIVKGFHVATFFFQNTSLDHGAATVATAKILRITAMLMLVGLSATVAAAAEWIFEAWFAGASDAEAKSNQFEFPDLFFFRGERFSDAIDLWRSRASILPPIHGSIGPGELNISDWTDFSVVVGRFRIIASERDSSLLAK